MPDFRIQAKELENGVVLINVEGYLDAHTFEQMEETIERLFDENKYKLVVNLEKVHYISSAGAGVFIGAIHQAHENEGNIVFLNPHVNVKDVFDLLGLSQIFSFASRIDEALGYF
ncbi:MAG: STAS domain-containing protein [Planctomycetes bacterium]|nr:STAS domain-containing protein [Planctomycetota bacterium]